MLGGGDVENWKFDTEKNYCKVKKSFDVEIGMLKLEPLAMKNETIFFLRIFLKEQFFEGK